MIENPTAKFEPAEFIAAFIQGAKQVHNLEINFCGIWNEITYEIAWIKRLRQTLDSKGLGAVKIVAPDLYTPNRWEIAKDMNRSKGAVAALLYRAMQQLRLTIAASEGQS